MYWQLPTIQLQQNYYQTKKHYGNKDIKNDGEKK